MRRQPALLTFLTVVLCLRPGSPLAGQQTDRARTIAFVDSVVNAAMRSTRTPGISVAVVRGGDTLVMKGYGQGDVENGVAVTPASVFRIGSLTKQFTAAAVMKLVEEGKLRLDGTIGDYLPEYQGPGRRVTIHQLLNHTSGIPSYTGLGEKFWGRSRLDLTHAQMLELFAADSLRFEPGTRFEYNNSGYYLLGMIIEKVTGHSYGEHIRSTIAQPNGLSTVTYCDESPIIPGRVEGYEIEKGGVVNAPPLSMNAPFAAGALCSTARDLVRWNSALVSGKVVSPASYTKMTTPTTFPGGGGEAYGYGLSPGRTGSYPYVAHSGGINGFSAFMAYYPQQQLTIAVLANMGSDAPGDIETAVAHHILGVTPPAAVAQPATDAPAKDLPTTAAERAQYLGTYDLAPAAPLKIRVFEDSGRLVGQATGQGPIPLRYQGDHTWLGPDGSGIRMVFAVESGRATQFTLHQGGRSGVAKRVAD
jgi:CubicO group peptidase (beta-lactamase class C family)